VLVVVGVEEDEVFGVADLDQPPAQGQGVDADPGRYPLEERLGVQPDPHYRPPPATGAPAGLSPPVATSENRSASASRQGRSGAPSRARPTIGSTKLRPRRPNTHEVRAMAQEPAWRATSRSPPSFERP